MEALVIHHHPCPDGFTAGWIAQRALELVGFSVERHEGIHGHLPPLDKARGRHVYILDFSYPRAQMLELAQAAKSLTVLDHHKTAQAALEGLDAEVQQLTGNEPTVVFDMNRSGAGLTWDFFHPGVPRPWLVEYTEARDLWRQDQLPNGREISLFLRSLPMDHAIYEQVARRPIESVIEQARGVDQQLRHYIEIALRDARLMQLHFTPPPTRALHRVDAVVICCSYDGVSDVLDAALARYPEAQMAVGWRVDAHGVYQLSLRSIPSYDCSNFARAYGGGGHAQAAGCRLRHTDPRELHLIRRLTWLEGRWGDNTSL